MIDPDTKKSIYPEHDIELYFDSQITLDDMQFVSTFLRVHVFILISFGLLFFAPSTGKQIAALDEHWNANKQSS